MDAHAFRFDAFRLLPEERRLLEGEKPVRISSRALDILTVLVDHAGELVSKEELIARAWPKTQVEENNLRVHIGALRKALGGGAASASYIATVPGRGYSFVAHVVRESVQPLLTAVSTSTKTDQLPAPLGRIIGRARALFMLSSRMRKERLVTIVGAGGIGKTTVALAAAKRLSQRLEHRGRFLDLSPLTDPGLVVPALSSVLGIPSTSESPLPGVLSYLRDKRMLIVLDGCEHLIDSAATLVEAVLRAAPGVRILATSREPLGAEGEWVERLPPLGMPEYQQGMTARQALTFPAVRLLVERIAASIEGFELSDEDTPAAVDICRKLDGIPLAIELAAARVSLFGISGLGARLESRLTVLTRGRRTAPPRHKTLGAMLDWSYEILSEREQEVFRRLGIFSGEFTPELAGDVASSSTLPSAEVQEICTSLVAKSLLVASIRHGAVWYRLLDTTREYAGQKLQRGSDFNAVSRLHAESLCKLLTHLHAVSATEVAAELRSICGRTVDDVRAALRWCFSPDGAPAIGVTLTALAAPLFIRLSLKDECRQHVDRVVNDGSLLALADRSTQLSLNLASGHVLLRISPSEAEVTAAYERALEIAESLGEPAQLTQALAGTWLACTRSADAIRALELAERFSRCIRANGVPAGSLAYSRMMAWSLHYLGRFAEARQFLERVLAHRSRSAQAFHDRMFFTDLQVFVSAIYARNCWMLGFPDQASEVARRSLERAVAIRDPTGICYALGVASGPIALWRGDVIEAGRLTSLLVEYSREYSLNTARPWVSCFERAIHLLTGKASAPLEADGFDAAGLQILQRDEIATLAERSIIPPEALARIRSGRVGWNAAELLRVNGEQLLRTRGHDAAVSAEELYLRSLETARRQGALSWQLRTATSLARLWRDQGRASEARDVLTGVYERFTEGFHTADYVKAGTLLRELSGNPASPVRVDAALRNARAVRPEE